MEKLTKVAEKLDNAAGTFPKCLPGNNDNTEWQSSCQKIMLSMAESIKRLEDKLTGPQGSACIAETNDTVHPKQNADEIIIVADSNAKHLKPQLIHDEKQVTVETRYTLDEAINKIPTRDNPEKVSDVVFMTGLNDSRKVDTSVETVLKRQKQACLEYSHRFKKARFHIASVAPVNPKQKNLNQRLKEYATNSGMSYIDNKDIFDRHSGNIRPGMLDGIHYTAFATKTVAKQLKHSLYSNESKRPNSANQGPQRNSTTNHVPESTTHNLANQENRGLVPLSGAASLLTAMESFFKKAELMLSSPSSINDTA